MPQSNDVESVMRQEEIEITFEDLLDREKIRQNLARYCRGVDRQDIELLSSTYWPESWDSHGIFECTGHDFCRAMPSVWPTMKTAHLLGEPYIELQGNFANAETYVFAYHRLGKEPDTKDAYIGARYNDRLEKRSGRWKFIHRVVVFDWYRDVGASFPWDDSVFALAKMPQRNYSATKSDYSWELFANTPFTRKVPPRD
jgi:hypothetical protein